MMQDYSKLMSRRLEIVRARNDFVNSLFFLFRPGLKRKVEKLDRQIANLDKRITNLRKLVMGRKVVRSSNLALRFYKRDGWLRETLEVYLIQGRILDTQDLHGDSVDDAYFIFDRGSKVDMKSLYLAEVSEVERRFNDYPEETDLEFLERMVCLC